MKISLLRAFPLLVVAGLAFLVGKLQAQEEDLFPCCREELVGGVPRACYVDETCLDTPPGISGGLGCNADGTANCRFCGWGVYADKIECPQGGSPPPTPPPAPTPLAPTQHTVTPPPITGGEEVNCPSLGWAGSCSAFTDRASCECWSNSSFNCNWVAGIPGVCSSGDIIQTPPSAPTPPPSTAVTPPPTTGGEEVNCASLGWAGSCSAFTDAASCNCWTSSSFRCSWSGGSCGNVPKFSLPLLDSATPLTCDDGDPYTRAVVRNWVFDCDGEADGELINAWRDPPVQRTYHIISSAQNMPPHFDYVTDAANRGETTLVCEIVDYDTIFIPGRYGQDRVYPPIFECNGVEYPAPNYYLGPTIFTGQPDPQSMLGRVCGLVDQLCLYELID